MFQKVTTETIMAGLQKNRISMEYATGLKVILELARDLELEVCCDVEAKKILLGDYSGVVSCTMPYDGEAETCQHVTGILQFFSLLSRAQQKAHNKSQFLELRQTELERRVARLEANVAEIANSASNQEQDDGASTETDLERLIQRAKAIGNEVDSSSSTDKLWYYRKWPHPKSEQRFLIKNAYDPRWSHNRSRRECSGGAWCFIYPHDLDMLERFIAHDEKLFLLFSTDDQADGNMLASLC